MIRKYLIFTLMMLCATAGFAQKEIFAQKKETKKIVFAVVDDGKTIEPIAYIDKGELKPIGGDEPDDASKSDFVKTHYKAKAKYNLIFGGANAGTVTVEKNLAGTECAANQANVSIVSKRVKPKGFVMALATNDVPKKAVKGTRGLPTAAERAELEKLVMAEMSKENIPIKKTNELRYHNLTKIDIDNDAQPEFVGSFWYNTAEKVRSLMFFIAEKDAKGAFSIAFKKFNRVEPEGIMSGEVADVDKGIYHELLIDVFDVDGDGSGEIFTMQQGFEGTNFNAYRKTGGEWKQVLETSNYHCAY